MELVTLRRGQGLRRGVAGRLPAGARRGGPDGRLRRGHRHHQGRQRRGGLLDPQPGPSGLHLLHSRRPGRRAGSCSASAPGGSRWRRRWGCAGCGHVEGDARDRGGVPRPAQRPDSHLPGASSCSSTGWSSTMCSRSAAPRTCPSTSGPPAHRMMALTGEIADGVVLNYLVSAQLQRSGHGAPRRGRGPGGAHRRRPGPAPVDRVLDGFGRLRGRAGRGARQCPHADHPVPGPAAPTS